MTGRLKTLGVALFALLALTAVAASTAGALKYTATSYPATGTGESALGNDTFTTEAGKVECKAHYQGSLVAAQSTLTITPMYTNCKAFGFLEATVSTNGCNYELTTPSETATDVYSSAVHVRCPSAPILITAATCKLTIGEQSPGGSVVVTNNTAAGDVSAKANVTGINYTVTQDGFGCPFAGTGAKTGATYVQDAAMTVQATNGAKVHLG